ncbi:MAG: hypothetical protein NVV63_08170 [Opitutus sp.]|nr:hypothetical protein [Opitutus sp.]
MRKCGAKLGGIRAASQLAIHRAGKQTAEHARFAVAEARPELTEQTGAGEAERSLSNVGVAGGMRKEDHGKGAQAAELAEH